MILTAVIDPITRIEGHLKIEIDIDVKNGVRQVVDAPGAWHALPGFREPAGWARSARTRNISPSASAACVPWRMAWAAVLTLDQAFGVAASIPANARIMRNLVMGANFVDSHILHFYLLCMVDFMDGPAMPPWTPTWRVDKRFSKAKTDALLQNYLQAIACAARLTRWARSLAGACRILPPTSWADSPLIRALSAFPAIRPT